MNSRSGQMLLSAGDPPPVRITNPRGASPFLLIGDHGGNAVPSALGSLGLSREEMGRHIAWDIGIAGLGKRLSAALDAVFIHQAYSRLVIDCNRDPRAPDAIPEVSDGVAIPGNRALSPAEREARVRAIHAPYQDAIAAELARRDGSGATALLVALHSFTPAMRGEERPWQIGVLHSGGDTRFALTILRLLQARGDLVVGDNQPYAMDGIDHSVPRHAFAARRPYVEIEIRQDLLERAEQQAAWAEMLAGLLEAAVGGGA